MDQVHHEAVDKSNALQARLGVLLRGQDVCPTPYQAPTEFSGGSPHFVVKTSQLQRLLALGFNKSRIAKLLGISRTTLWRKMQELMVQKVYSAISDEELYARVRRYRTDHPLLASI